MEKLQHRKKDHFLLTWTKWNKKESNAWPSLWRAMFFCHMKVLGITAEYNPFHNGHQYQMDAAKKLVHPDQTIVAMSGDFTQRGEPAIADKWSRSKWAVLCGADLVFELPFLYACNRAPFFAAGGVDLLVASGATHISFGCEAEDPDCLWNMAEEIRRQEDTLAEAAKAGMTDGVSYAKAYEAAVRQLLGEDAANLILKPNNILALEYLKRILYWRDHGYQIEAVPVQRIGSGYDDINLKQGFAGASQIRNKFFSDGTDVVSLCDDLRQLMPREVCHLLEEDGIEAFCKSNREAQRRYFQILKSVLVRSTKEELAAIYCVGEGIENRFLKEIAMADDLDSFVRRIVSKRYTSAAVRRMLIYTAFGLKGIEADQLTGDVESAAFCIPYLRVLAASKCGREHIRTLRKQEELLVITNVNKVDLKEERSQGLLDLDLRAADLYNTLFGRRLYDYSDRVKRPYIALD